MTSRYEFLAALHEIIKPRTYLEIGVQYGHSLNLAKYSEVAIGIDPQPLTQPHGNQVLFSMTSDEYFREHKSLQKVDFAFIDGMHLFEYAYRDFFNIERRSHPGTVVVFDDMLPRNQAEAAREQCPGDWAGDVWKVYYLLKDDRPDLKLIPVDTFPTGTLVVLGLDAWGQSYEWDPAYVGTDTVTSEILDRTHAFSPEMATGIVAWWLKHGFVPETDEEED